MDAEDELNFDDAHDKSLSIDSLDMISFQN
jgi:hypothetical protein